MLLLTYHTSDYEPTFLWNSLRYSHLAIFAYHLRGHRSSLPCTSSLKPDHMDADLHDRVQLMRLELLSGVPRADGGEKEGLQIDGATA
jgi:hypothetical protein